MTFDCDEACHQQKQGVLPILSANAPCCPAWLSRFHDSVEICGRRTFDFDEKCDERHFGRPAQPQSNGSLLCLPTVFSRLAIVAFHEHSQFVCNDQGNEQKFGCCAYPPTGRLEQWTRFVLCERDAAMGNSVDIFSMTFFFDDVYNPIRYGRPARCQIHGVWLSCLVVSCPWSCRHLSAQDI